MPPECDCLRAAKPRLELLYNLPLLLLSAAALESERKCSVITCYRWHNIAASAAKPPRQTIASLYKSKVGGNCVRLTNRRQSDSEDRSKPSRLDTTLGKQCNPQAKRMFKGRHTMQTPFFWTVTPPVFFLGKENGGCGLAARRRHIPPRCARKILCSCYRRNLIFPQD